MVEMSRYDRARRILNERISFRMNRIPFPCLLICCLIPFFAGCATQVAPPSNLNPQPISVTISPQMAAIGTGQTEQLTANVVNDTSGLVWLATAGTIDSSGNYTAPGGAQSMTVVAIAISKKDPTKSA